MAAENNLSLAKAAPNRFAISSSRVVTPSGEISAAIVIEGEKILAVVPRDQLPSDIPLTDFGDQIISPGVVDAHVHINEPGRTEWEGFASATAAAAAGGVTTLIDMPLNSSPVTVTAENLQTKRDAAAGKCQVDVGFYGGLVPGHESDLPGLIENGALGIKAFLCDSGLPEFPAAGEFELCAALEILKPLGTPLLVHAELIDPPTAVDSFQIHPPTPGSDPRSYQQYANSRPAEFEIAAIEWMIRLCRQYQSPIHIVHLATASALPLVAAAKHEGLPLTVETCPHYLYFSDDQIGEGQTAFKCAPPIRDEANRLALCAAVTDGSIETIGSDHSPCPPELKHLESGNFRSAWGGISSLQLTLPIVWTVGQTVGWTPTLLAERLSARPAEIFGLGNRKGKIEPGFDADFVVWNPDTKFLVSGTRLFHRHSVTPYEGRELAGVVQQTFVRGQTVFQDSELSGSPRGKLLRRIEKPSAKTAIPTQIVKRFNRLNHDQQIDLLETCCAARTWIRRMLAGGSFHDDDELMKRAADSWIGMDEADLLEAFSAHPRIGDINSLRKKYANTESIASDEQRGVQLANENVIQRLAELNEQYFQRFGFIFVVCATGKTAQQMLDLLAQRVSNDRPTELQIAAVEQLKITLIRLQKLAG